MALIHVLIVHETGDLATIWAGFLERQGVHATVAPSVAEAHEVLRVQPFDALVLDVELPNGAALAIADMAAFRNPDIPIIAVTARGFFSDSTIFQLIPNARGLLRAPLRPEDMAALVSHYGGRHVARMQAAAGGASGG